MASAYTSDLRGRSPSLHSAQQLQQHPDDDPAEASGSDETKAVVASLSDALGADVFVAPSQRRHLQVVSICVSITAGITR